MFNRWSSQELIEVCFVRTGVYCRIGKRPDADFLAHGFSQEFVIWLIEMDIFRYFDLTPVGSKFIPWWSFLCQVGLCHRLELFILVSPRILKIPYFSKGKQGTKNSRKKRSHWWLNFCLKRRPVFSCSDWLPTFVRNVVFLCAFISGWQYLSHSLSLLVSSVSLVVAWQYSSYNVGRGILLHSTFNETFLQCSTALQ